MEDYNIDELVSQLDFSSNALQMVGKGILLTNHEIEILDRYKIPYQKCSSLKEVLFEIEEVLEDMDFEEDELDQISSSISERDYYQNTNK